MPYTPVCPYCRQPSVLTPSSVIYGPGTNYGMFWRCAPCDAYVGTHKSSPWHAPLGRLANSELRALKVKTHAAFDPLWRGGLMTRTEAYDLLAKILDIPRGRAHIGMFDPAQCRRVIGRLAPYSLPPAPIVEAKTDGVMFEVTINKFTETV